MLRFEALDLARDLVADRNHFAPERSGPFEGALTMSQPGRYAIGELNFCQQTSNGLIKIRAWARRAVGNGILKIMKRFLAQFFQVNQLEYHGSTLSNFSAQINGRFEIKNCPAWGRSIFLCV